MLFLGSGLVVIIIYPLLTSCDQIDVFCKQYIQNQNRFDFGTDAVINTGVYQSVYIGNNSWDVVYNTGLSAIHLDFQMASFGDFPIKYQMSFIYLNEHFRPFQAFYKEGRPNIDVQDLKSLQVPPPWAHIPNNWQNTQSFKPSVAFGPINSSVAKANTVVFVVQQTSVGNGQYQRTTQVYSWIAHYGSLVDETQRSVHLIPLFISKLDPKLYINVIFPFHNQKKYLVIFDDPIGPRACFTTTDMINNECLESNLFYLARCSTMPTVTIPPMTSPLITNPQTTGPMITNSPTTGSMITTNPMTIPMVTTSSVLSGNLHLTGIPINETIPSMVMHTNNALTITTPKMTIKDSINSDNKLIWILIICLVVALIIVFMVVALIICLIRNKKKDDEMGYSAEKRSEMSRSLIALSTVRTVDSMTGHSKHNHPSISANSMRTN